MRYLLALLISLHFAGPALALAPQVDGPRLSARPVHRTTFEFHSAFLLNLHHFLFDAAKYGDKLKTLVWQVAPSAAEAKTLLDAVEFYQTNYAQRDLLFDDAMADIRGKISVDDALHDPAGLKLPPALAATLASVAPIYARCIWSVQDKANQDWIRHAMALDALYGAEIQAGIEKYLAHKFAHAPIRVDVVVATGTRSGAYTSDEPMQSVIPSGREDYQGLAALEMLYHEASHIGVTETLRDAIDGELAVGKRKGDRGLWHAVQFYTVGEVVKGVLQRSGKLNYQPYAVRNGVYSRGWSAFEPLLDDVWLSYMQGKMGMQEAVRLMGLMVERGLGDVLQRK